VKYPPPVVIPFPIGVQEMGIPSGRTGISNSTTTHASKLVRILREIGRGRADRGMESRNGFYTRPTERTRHFVA